MHVHRGTARLAVMFTLLFVTVSLTGMGTDAHVYVHRGHSMIGCDVYFVFFVTGSLTGLGLTDLGRSAGY